jgi:hypothetical protein
MPAAEIMEMLFFILYIAWFLAVLGLVIILRRLGVPRGRAIISGFLIYGFVIGASSYQVGKRDIVAVLNLPGDVLSETVYNDYLIPYWKNTLEPVGYQHIPIRDLKTGEIIGTEAVPQYEFPLENVSDLYLPASILSWGIIGLLLQLIYNRWKR